MFLKIIIYAHQIDGDPCVYMGNFTSDISTRAVRHITAITSELLLKQ